MLLKDSLTFLQSLGLTESSMVKVNNNNNNNKQNNKKTLLMFSVF